MSTVFNTIIHFIKNTQFDLFYFFNINSFVLIGGELLYNIVLVLPYINMNPPQVYTCSPSWTRLSPPSPYHPSGSSQCTSPKHPVSYIEPGLAIRFIYDIIHVSVAFSQTSHPRPLPQSPKDCSIHLCLFCCLAYRVIVNHLSKFHIYALVYCIGVFLSGLLHSV